MKVLVKIPNPGDCTSFYRAEGPLAALSKTYRNFEWNYAFQGNWAELARYDALFLQRPGSTNDLLAIEMAHQMGIPVIVDYDDNLLAVEQDSMYYTRWVENNVGGVVTKIIEKADLVISSTAAIQKAYGKGTVIPNAHNDYIYPVEKRQTSSDNKTIIWRGSSFHQATLLAKAKDIVELINDFPDWKFIFMGYLPWFISENVGKGRVTYIPDNDIIVYLKTLKQLNPTIGIAPLRETEFNLAKSDCSFLEQCYAGACFVAPAMQEWEHSGIINYYPGKFKETLQDLMLAPQVYRTNIANQGWEYIKKERLLSYVNQFRVDAFENLLLKEKLALK